MSIWQPMSVRPWPDSYLTRDCGLKGFMDDIHLALSTPGQEVSGHCSDCVTDYAAVAVYGELLIKRWSDLGRYLSPLSPENPEFEARVSGFDRRLVESPYLTFPAVFVKDIPTAFERYQRHARVT
ncbi:f-box domain containing protein [Colletotrichum sojae]|uniref:F-box domain containing protein n=1 Tax=Colletotrichum sojae TaxID=2175907 RepID=A0A8H6J0T3_9PEZI|nr:f-box domain containing protein [Colletotrichum sojae]